MATWRTRPGGGVDGVRKARRSVTRLVDRHIEQQRILRAIQDALHHHGSAVLVTGEIGIGKTCLCAEAVARKPHGAVVLEGAPPVGAHQPVLAAVADSLRGVEAGARARVWRALGSRAAHLSGVLPELAATGERATVDEQLVFHALLEGVAEAAGETPVIWHLDDMQRADLATWHFVWYLCRHVVDRGVVVLASCRDDDVIAAQAAGPPLLALSHDQGAIEVHLDRLGPADTERLARSGPGAELPATTIDRIVERSAGNPRAAVELVEAAIAGHQDAVPPSIRHAEALRVSTLSPAAAEMLTSLAVMETEPSVQLVLAMPRATEAALAELSQAGLVHVTAEQRQPVVRFRHPLYRDAARQRSSWARRRLVHAELGRVLERMDDQWDVATMVATARHQELGGDPGRAIQYLGAAARALRAAGESRAAGDLFLAELQALERNPGIAASRHQAVLSAMQELCVGGRWTELLPIAQRAWRSPSRPLGAEKAKLAAVLGTSLLMAGRVEEADTLLATQTSQLERAGREHSAPSLLAAASAAALCRGHLSKTRALCEGALRADEPGVRSFARCVSTVVRFRSDRDRNAAADAFAELSDSARTVGLTGLAAFGRWNRARMTTRLEDALQVEAMGERECPLVPELSRLLVATIHLLEGRESHATTALDRARSELGASAPLVMPLLDGLQAHVDLHLGEVERARSRLEPWSGERPELWSLARAVVLGAQGWLAWEADSLEAADERWTRCAQECAVSGYGLFESGPLLIQLHVDALVRLGRLEEARRAVSAAETRAAPDRFFSASLAAAKFRLSPSAESWDQARELAAAAPWPLLEAWLGCWCAQLLDNQSAGRAGVRLASAIGARLAAERTSRLLASMAAPGPGHGRDSSDGPARHLSPRELQVAALVADGLSNSAIADRLNVSVATVTTHVKNILSKLNFRSRAQVAAWVSDQRARSWENDVLLRLGRKVLP